MDPLTIKSDGVLVNVGVKVIVGVYVDVEVELGCVVGVFGGWVFLQLSKNETTITKNGHDKRTGSLEFLLIPLNTA